MRRDDFLWTNVTIIRGGKTSEQVILTEKNKDNSFGKIRLASVKSITIYYKSEKAQFSTQLKIPPTPEVAQKMKKL